MNQTNEEIVSKSATFYPDAGACYGHAWRQMWKYFLELLLIGVIAFLLSLPSWGMSVFDHMGWPIAFPIFIFSLGYSLVFLGPLEYGVSFAFLKASRGNRLQAQDMFDVFQNWGNAILARLITGIIITVGFFFLIIPGIIFACKLAFVPYLVVDRKMDAIDAVQTSWRMTSGHAFTVFLIGFISIFIAIAGFVCFFVGIIVAGIWIELAFASLYYSVSTSEKDSDSQK